VRAIICSLLCPLGLVICACPPASAVTAPVAQSCAPKATGAKILRTKNVKDVDPNWAPPAFIGTSWSLIEIKREGKFLRGRLVDPRGGIQRGRVFVIASEWDCG
jgi:hypothetical protein